MIAFEDVHVRLGGRAVLTGVSLTIPEGSLCVFVGPSGAGKSTLLRLVNRMVEPSAGTVRLRGEDVARADPVRLRRSIGYAIQSTGLFPHRTVAENVATVPRLLGWPRERVEERVDAMLALVHLDPREFGSRFPAALSGGQAQRVGIARALAADPDLLLMDEPFGAVDPVTRRALRAELRRIHGETGKTILFVTHDPAEALELADRLVVLDRGRLVAAGPPADLAAQAEGFVADLLGPDRAFRLLSARRAGDVCRSGPVDGGAPVIAADATLGDALAAMIVHRARSLTVLDDGGAPLGRLALGDLVEEPA